jgi:flavin-dependent thymidylate synthase
MRVVLAGYNVDAQVLEEAQRAGMAKDRLTPEVFSAAYARISRDPRPVGELRREALFEVEKARRSNRRIIFGMGHHSVAEHAVFNYDITGVSRLAIEALEQFRLCSFTEKSQRYIKLDHDFVIPPELSGAPAEAALCELVARQAETYDAIYARLLERLERQQPEAAAKRSGRRLLEGSAKEDARYAISLATSGQLGLTANARNLEHIVRRLAASPLGELRELGVKLLSAGAQVAPSLMLFTEPAAFDVETPRELAAWAKTALGPKDDPPPEPAAARIVFEPEEADRRVAAALLFRFSDRGFADCLRAAGELDRDRLCELFETSMRHMEFFDSPLREFEHVQLTFEVVLSASCYAQLKRHRMTSQTVQDYSPELGVTVPPSIAEAGLEERLTESVELAEDLYRRLCEEHPIAAPYALSNAHRRRVLISCNLREMYHLVRLREDIHAQWDIRSLAGRLRELVEASMPLGSLLLCGKDGFAERFERIFGRRPAIDPQGG